MPLDENAAFTEWEFTSNQWTGLVTSGTVAATISLIANLCVLIVHFSIMWFRPNIVNRLSLRLIVCSCVLNSIYNVGQSVSYHIPGTGVQCRRLSYVLSSSDVMSSMCLAMVGLSLVMIFVLKLSRTLKLELMYYFIVAVSGLLTVVIPNQLGNKVVGPINPNDPTKCWYYYHYGRKRNLFNWIYYYSWLLFSEIFAAICAILSIRFIFKRQENFSGAMDMFTRRGIKKDLTTMAILRKYANDNTDVFRKIAKRCVCYPLVPLISKSWGVSIVIAGSLKAPIPYPIYVLDRLFASFLGLLVSCIYFTDPAIEAVFKNGLEAIKRRYVHDYFVLKVIPCKHLEGKPACQLPQIVKIAPARSLSIKEVPKHNMSTGSSVIEDSHLLSCPLNSTYSLQQHITSVRGSAISSNQSQTKEPKITFHTEEGRKMIQSVPKTDQFVIVWVKSRKGDEFTPPIKDNERSNTVTDWSNEKGDEEHCLFISMRRLNKEDRPKVVKMEDPTLGADRFVRPYQRYDSYQRNADYVETLVPYKVPFAARFMYWMLTTIFRVKPSSSLEEDDYLSEQNLKEQNNPYQRQFHDYTEATPDQSSSNVQQRKGSLAVSQPSSTATHPLQVDPQAPMDRFTPSPRSLEEGRGQHLEEVWSLPQPNHKPTNHSDDTLSYISAAFRRKRSNSFGEGMAPSDYHKAPMKRVFSVSIADMQRHKERKGGFLGSPSTSSIASSGSKRKLLADMSKKLTGLSRIGERGRSLKMSSDEASKQTKSFSDISTPTISPQQQGEPTFSNNTEQSAETEPDVRNSPFENTTRLDSYENNTHSTPKDFSSASNGSLRQSTAADERTSKGRNISRAAALYPMALSPPPRLVGRKRTAPMNGGQEYSPIHFGRAPPHELLQNNLTPLSGDSNGLGIAFDVGDDTGSHTTSHLGEMAAAAANRRQSGNTSILNCRKSTGSVSVVRPLPDEQDGLVYGKTTLEYISNWEDSEADDTYRNRIKYLTEKWLF